jgi:acid phosphatase (class A)
MKVPGRSAWLLLLCGLPVFAAEPLSPGAPTANTPVPPAARCERNLESGPRYLLPTQRDALALLPPPPAADSSRQRADLQAVLAAQRAATKAGTTARAVADAEVSCTRFAGALGEHLELSPGMVALGFATRAALQASAVTAAPKHYWHRSRPYLTSPAVRRLADVAPGQKLAADYAQERDHGSYPSGHAAFGAACAILLADMLPERRTEIFARGHDYAAARVIVGAHYPSDVEAGVVVGTAAVAVMMTDPCFQEDFAAARSAMRRALGLPAVPEATGATTAPGGDPSP